MSNEMEQIRILFEQEGMTVDQIATERTLTVDAVKTALMSCSSTYKKLCKNEPEDESVYNFSKEQHIRALNQIADLSTSAENESVRLRAAIFIRDDAKGRLDVVKQVGGFQFNILQVDTRLRKAMAAMTPLKQIGTASE